MDPRLNLLRIVPLLLGLFLAAGITGCAGPPRPAPAAEVQSLKAALQGLAITVREDEAERVAGSAYDYSRELAMRYRVVRPALWHNFLVNTGHKERGLCYEWAEDLLAELQSFNLASLQLRWAIARAETAREHNAVVVTAPDQPFAQGIVLDPWRRGGKLVWSPVMADRYPWVEGELTNSPTAVRP